MSYCPALGRMVRSTHFGRALSKECIADLSKDEPFQWWQYPYVPKRADDKAWKNGHCVIAVYSDPACRGQSLTLDMEEKK